jgi:hypothetical protein
MKYTTKLQHEGTVPDKSTENVEKFKHLGKTITNQNHIHEKYSEQIKFEKYLIPFGT